MYFIDKICFYSIYSISFYKFDLVIEMYLMLKTNGLTFIDKVR